MKSTTTNSAYLPNNLHDSLQLSMNNVSMYKKNHRQVATKTKPQWNIITRLNKGARSLACCVVTKRIEKLF